MEDSLYYCTQENNTCPRRESCKRYISEDQCRATLFKAACTEDNNYVLFIKIEDSSKEGEES